jgi:hypothetical protein
MVRGIQALLRLTDNQSVPEVTEMLPSPRRFEGALLLMGASHE